MRLLHSHSIPITVQATGDTSGEASRSGDQVHARTNYVNRLPLSRQLSLAQVAWKKNSVGL